MKAKPTHHPGEVTFELGRRDEPLMAAATEAARHPPFKLKEILVPIDFSECSLKALQYALPLAREHGAAITLLHVVNPVYLAGELGGTDYPSLEAEMRASADKELSRLVVDEIHGDVPADTRLCAGSPETNIIAVAKSLPADLIVIATHGRTGLKHLFLGSVVEHVVRRAPCPVLVVREHEHEFLAA